MGGEVMDAATAYESRALIAEQKAMDDLDAGLDLAIRTLEAYRQPFAKWSAEYWAIGAGIVELNRVRGAL